MFKINFHIINYTTKPCIFLAIQLFFAINSVSQSQATDSARIAENYSKELAETIKDYKASQLSPIYALLPSFGLTAIYNSERQAVQLFPTASISFSQYIRARKEKLRQERELNRLETSLQKQLDQDIKKSKKLQNSILLAELNYNLAREKSSIQNKIFRFDSMRYENNEIRPDEYYRSKLAQLTALQAAIIAEQNIIELQKELADIIKE